jgi:hypothetical protein
MVGAAPGGRDPAPQLLSVPQLGVTILRNFDCASFDAGHGNNVASIDMSTNGPVYALGTMGLFALIGGWAYYNVLARLTQSHDALWEGLGRPAPFKTRSIW